MNACGGGWVQFEIMGDSLSASTLASISLTSFSYPRLSFDNLLDLNDDPEWTMVKISRATAGMRPTDPPTHRPSNWLSH